MLEELLEDFGLKQCYPNKLSLSSVLEIGRESITDEPIQSLSSLPRQFLKKLMTLNVRSVKFNQSNDVTAEDTDTEWDSDEENLSDKEDKPIQSLSRPWQFLQRLMTRGKSVTPAQSDDATAEDADTKGGSDEENLSDKKDVNPLDIITALFLCSDPFLQQEMSLKLSLCQLSVPFLLPNNATKQITFLLWAMRDIVKKFRPHSLADSRGFVEERIVFSKLPLLSFVRLSKSNLSKSHILNLILSNPQQYHNTFVHRNMESGDALKKISNGLVEISWYMPCGNKSIDIFPEPVAVANLRGDISTFETQYNFLCQVSAAVFVFFDNLDTNYKMPQSQPEKGQLFLVVNTQSSTFNKSALKNEAKRLGLRKKNVILRDKQNEADFIKTLQSIVTSIITDSPQKMTLEEMTTVAKDLKIHVDEHSKECQDAKRNADAITSQIQDIQKFKEKHLPLQGKIWLELAKVEKEECRLKKAGNRTIEEYKSDLKIQKMKLRENQRQHDMSKAMSSFILALSSTSLERTFFMRWMRMNLDNVSTTKLSTLREQYKKKIQDPENNKEEIAELDNKMAMSSLGIEHFLREMGQLYESAVTLQETQESRKQMLSLPKHCAELLLEGFPIELVDGDASNIPIRWVSDVLGELNNLVEANNKMLVVTVLGVQSTGKSTLLNTMFGVQFAVSSGRCTRGAFMLLIKLKGDIRTELRCDFLLIIDTEGLKSSELAQLDYSYEHDNELATLVVGLSDVTIINIAMENSTDMKDILQIVVHAFLRMDKVGKKPKCLFLHQNVADVSAHDKNMKDRKILLEQLNAMTQAASKMENGEENKKFTDVMDFNPETDSFYIPGLWHGTPPMSPVSAGYSESVFDLKKKIIGVFNSCTTSRNTIHDFLKWTESLWSAVKFENFIFSFRNSLVADAYMKLCTEFSKWEWKFRLDMHTWVTTAVTSISNFGKFSDPSQASDINAVLNQLKAEALQEFSKGETYILDSIVSYYKKTDSYVELVEKYRADFENSAKSLRKELQNSVTNHLHSATSLRQGMIRLESIKKKHTNVMEERVLKLLEDCRKSKSVKTEEELESDFEKMWHETMQELSFKGLEKQNVMQKVFTQIWNNLNQKGSSVAESLNKVKLHDCGLEPFIVTEEGWGIFKMIKEMWHHQRIMEAQEMSDTLIANCEQIVGNYTSKETDYDDTYTREILNKIDETLNINQHLKKNEKFEVSLKLHICANAARKFEKMHERFIKNNDPQRCLEESKEKYWTDFRDIFHERDQSQKKADEFASTCLKPAVEMYINSFLGQDIVDKVLSEARLKFNSRGSFQYTLLQQLLDESNFEMYHNYISSYKKFVKNWISEQITECCPEDVILKLEEKHLSDIIKNIKVAISGAEEETSSNIKDFINKVCTSLESQLTIPNDALLKFLTLNNANQKTFVKWLLKSVDELEPQMQNSLKETPITVKLESVGINPQDELFKRVFGCGHQCPFCKAPCEAGGKEHSEHFASIHRPQGLRGFRRATGVLVSDICSSLVATDKHFVFVKGSSHPCKKYKEIFPDWHIYPDSTVESSDYWRYVLTTFNQKFAKEYEAKPADIPEAWGQITKERAEQALKEMYNMK